MTRFYTAIAALPAMVLAAGLTFGTAPAAAQSDTASPATSPAPVTDKHKPGTQRKGRMVMAPEDLDKIQNMSSEEREAFFKAKHEKWQGMSEEERAAERAKQKTKFDALTPEQKEALKDRQKKIGEKMRAEHEKKIESMSPEEKAAHLKKIKERKAHLNDKYKDMTPDQKDHFKQRLERKRGKVQQERVSPME